MILKKTLICIIVALSYLFYYQIGSKPHILSAQELKNQHLHAIEPNKVIILWDLHQVVFDRSITHWIYLFITQVKFFSIIHHLNLSTLKILITFVLRKMKLYSEEITSEELIVEAKKANNHALIDLIMLIACDYYPNQEVVAIIRSLQSKYITQHVGSNIGRTAFTVFIQKYPEVFAYFSHYQIVEANPLPIAKKPDALFFKRYLADTQQKPENIIFIDDRTANVAAAQKEGMIGIHFSTAEQLIKDLQILGIFLP